MPPDPSPPRRVLVVDDEPAMRLLLKHILSAAPGLEVAGAADSAAMAREMANRLKPDVITLDIMMPGTDGLTFLADLMAHRPTPVVMVSALTRAGADATLEALGRGAVDWVAKPDPASDRDVLEFRDDLVRKACAASFARLRLRAGGGEGSERPAGRRPPTGDRLRPPDPEALIAIGASTGGTEALRRILPLLPATAPPVLIVQHLPETVTPAFARRLDALCEMEVREAREGDRPRPGRALLAPGGRHMVLRRGGGGLTVALDEGPKEHHCRPSVDILFRSVAKAAGEKSVGVVMTGMGADGADGLARIRRAGGRTIAQDEASCVVFGMPGAAIRAGAAEHVLPLDEIPEKVLALSGALGGPEGR